MIVTKIEERLKTQVERGASLWFGALRKGG